MRDEIPWDRGTRTDGKDETRPRVQIRDNLLSDSWLDFVHGVTRTYYYRDPRLLIAPDALSLRFRVTRREAKGERRRKMERKDGS